MKIKIVLIICGLLLGNPLNSQDRKLRVVTTTADLAYLAKEVGGNHVEVESLLSPVADPHFSDARPDFIVKLSRADVFAQIGMDLEIGWVPPLLQQSRNPKIFVGAVGYCDASVGIHVLEKPTGKVDRSFGDIHIYGNPHYWLDPLNAAIMARNLRDALIRVDSMNKANYEQNYNTLFESMRNLTKIQVNRMAPLKGMKVAVYHKEFSYLANRFGFEAAISVEEKPGVPPSATFLKTVVDTMNQNKIKLILIAPYQNQRYAKSVAERTGAKIIVMPTSVGAMHEITSYTALITKMIDLLIENR